MILIWTPGNFKFSISINSIIELTGGHIQVMLFIEMEKIELMIGHIGIMPFIEVENLEFPGGHFEIIINHKGWRPISYCFNNNSIPVDREHELS